MEVLTLSLLGVGLAADAFTVSVTSGLLIQRIKLNKALKIALFFGGFQALMPILGWMIGLSFREWIVEIDHWVVFGVLGAIGGKMIYEALWGDSEEAAFNPLEFFTLLGLAIATSIDALATGLGLSVIHSSIFVAASLIGVITFVLSLIGVFLGHRLGDILNTKVDILGGLILIVIGSRILWEHLMIVG
jgi:putative Mn2+ efflux pump MntP